MPRPRAPTRSLFEHTGTRRCGGKFDVYRCKRCGVEILENAYRFAVHISVCKQATDEDRALAQQQLTKSKKGSNYQSPRNSLPGDVELAGLVASVRERAQSISGLNKDDITTKLLQQVVSRFQSEGGLSPDVAPQPVESTTPKRKAPEVQPEPLGGVFPAESMLDSGLVGGREFYHVYSRDSRWDAAPRVNNGIPANHGGVSHGQRRAYDCEADLPQYSFGMAFDLSRRHSVHSNSSANPFALEEQAMAAAASFGETDLGDDFFCGPGPVGKQFEEDLDALVASVTGNACGQPPQQQQQQQQQQVSAAPFVSLDPPPPVVTTSLNAANLAFEAFESSGTFSHGAPSFSDHLPQQQLPIQQQQQLPIQQQHLPQQHLSGMDNFGWGVSDEAGGKNVASLGSDIHIQSVVPPAGGFGAGQQFNGFA